LTFSFIFKIRLSDSKYFMVLTNHRSSVTLKKETQSKQCLVLLHVLSDIIINTIYTKN